MKYTIFVLKNKLFHKLDRLNNVKNECIECSAMNCEHLIKYNTWYIMQCIGCKVWDAMHGLQWMGCNT